MKLFGTDGIRGVANSGCLTPDVIMKVAVATTSILNKKISGRNKILIGKDTRLSGYMLENSLTAGFVASGTDVLLVGPLPSPAVAMLTKSLRADLGVMISASHNSYQDNGIKIFNANGHKISDDIQKHITQIINNDTWYEFLANPDDLGKAKRIDDARGRYIEFVKNSFPKKLTLEGLRIVIDCANGAAYQIGPIILSELGAEVIPLANNPNGYNINEKCGATYPKYLANYVRALNADIGIALDGDADRLIIADETGNVIDGDTILALIATHWKKHGLLNNNKIISTVMANKGLEDYLNSIDLELIRTQVGDRYVTETMKAVSSNIGGEQSGHIIMSDYSTSGDGLIAALQVLAVLVEQKRKASEIFSLFRPYPQLIRNTKIKKDIDIDTKNFNDFVSDIETKENVRILVRKSGTEPLIRIMVEGKDFDKINKISEKIEEKIISINI